MLEILGEGSEAAILKVPQSIIIYMLEIKKSHSKEKEEKDCIYYLSIYLPIKYLSSIIIYLFIHK